MKPHPAITAGTAVFLNRTKDTVPLAMRANLEHNHVVHEHVIVLSVLTEETPYVADEDRIEIDPLGWTDDGIVHVTVRYGYAESPDVPAALQIACGMSDELEVEPEDTTYFVSTIDLRMGDQPGMARWRKHLFIGTASIAADAVDYFALPRDRTITIGSTIEI
jgi:KUP system potassium uptake protein